MAFRKNIRVFIFLVISVFFPVENILSQKQIGFKLFYIENTLVYDPFINVFGIGFFIGFVSILLIYSLLVYLNLRQSVFLWFFIYTLNLLLYLILSLKASIITVVDWSNELILMSLISVFYSYKILFQKLINTSLNNRITHKWIDIIFSIGLFTLVLHLVFSKWIFLEVIFSIAFEITVLMFLYCLFKTQELSKAQRNLLILSQISVLVFGGILTLFILKLDNDFNYIQYIYALISIHVLLYSMSILYRIKTLRDQKEKLWNEIKKTKIDLLESYLEGAREEKNRTLKELNYQVINELDKLVFNKTSIKKYNHEIEFLVSDLELITNNDGFNESIKFGLIQKIEKLIAERNTSQCNFLFQHFNYIKPLPIQFENHVFRIVQEAIQNIEKYAEAKNVKVQINQNNKAFSLLIEDDGLGFDMGSTANGIGIINMKNRVRQMNGTFHIESIKSNGVTIMVTLNN